MKTLWLQDKQLDKPTKHRSEFITKTFGKYDRKITIPFLQIGPLRQYAIIVLLSFYLLEFKWRHLAELAFCRRKNDSTIK